MAAALESAGRVIEFVRRNEKLIIMSIFIGFAVLEIVSGRFLNKDKSKDSIIELINTTPISNILWYREFTRVKLAAGVTLAFNESFIQ
ncbi:MAG: hypothetical protein ACJAS9_003234 [Polaribacter sp.]